MADKPIILSMTPWDATKEYQMKFTYSGALPVSNRLTIYNDSGAQVYDNTENSSHFYHTIEARKLTNGYKYKAHIVVTDNRGITSVVSDDVWFFCQSTPIFQYLSPSSENINKSSVDLFIKYNQSQQESLKDPLFSYQHRLYNYSKQVIATSDMYYNRTTDILYYINYTFSGLENKTHYYIQSEGVTKSGVPVKTEMKHLFVDFEQSMTANVLNTYSDDNATVTGNLHVIAIDADENPENYTFIGSQVLLLNQDIHYNNNFEIVGDFTCSLKARMTHGDKRLLKMNRKNSTGYIEVSSNLYENSVVYRLRVNNGMTDYNLFSEPMNVLDSDEVLIHFRRINNIYKLVVFKLT